MTIFKICAKDEVVGVCGELGKARKLAGRLLVVFTDVETGGDTTN